VRRPRLEPDGGDLLLDRLDRSVALQDPRRFIRPDALEAGPVMPNSIESADRKAGDIGLATVADRRIGVFAVPMS